MKKCLLFILLVPMIMVCLGLLGLIKDRHILNTEILRLHVVGNSDEIQDQENKIAVKNTIIEYMRKEIPMGYDKIETKRWIIDNKDKIEAIANECLETQGSSDVVCVSVRKEQFPVREYDTFKLPSGVYDAVRVEIGEAKGKNWWCVVFPELCVPATSSAFCETAKESGFSDDLVSSLSKDGKYEIRFFFLDWLGRMENFFHFA